MTVAALAALGTQPAQRTSVRLREWERLAPGDEGQARHLRGLSLENGQARSIAAELSRAGVVTITELGAGLSVETGSFIGRLAVGPLELTIVPKIEWNRWLTLVGYALRLRGLARTGPLAMRTAEVPLQDLLVQELVAEARDLIARGLHREYVRRRERLASPRGRIDFDRIATGGGIRGPAIPCRFTRRSDDSPLNRALLAGLGLGARLARDMALRSDARRLRRQLEGTVSPAAISGEILREAREALDRRTTRYAPALRLIELLYSGSAVTLEDQPERPRLPLPGFAVDMNRLWQRLVARVLTEWNEGIEVREEYALRGIFRRNPDYPLRRSLPVPRPDFAAFQEGRLIAFLDAKYRDLWAEGLPREMLYQLALYAAAQGRGAAAMLYPTDAASAVEQRVDISDPITASVRASVALRPVRLKVLESLIRAPRAVHREEARRAFAHSLLSHFA